MAFPIRFKLRDLLVIVFLTALAALVIMPMWLNSRRNERLTSAVRSFGVIQRAELDLQAHDFDGNGVQDFWSRDIRGLERIRPKGSSAGLIDHRLSAADAAYTDIEEAYGHLFKMLAGDENDQPLAGPSGFGLRYAFLMYSAREGEFKNLWMSIDGEPWKKWGHEGPPPRRILRSPGGEGWARGGG